MSTALVSSAVYIMLFDYTFIGYAFQETKVMGVFGRERSRNANQECQPAEAELALGDSIVDFCCSGRRIGREGGRGPNQ